jgi:hypothetical protein
VSVAVASAHSFLVHPAKGEETQPQIGGTLVPKTGKLADMLGNVFERAPTECNIEIIFRPGDDGRQINDRRNKFLQYLEHPTLPRGRKIATALQEVTTHRSGLGLLFLISGTANGQQRLVISRFPADQGVIAEENRQKLSVEFLERVFMKSANSYKSAVYESDSIARGFWDGRAVDKQISGTAKELSDYWIFDFLDSELRTTGPAGTKRIAVALREAISRAPEVRVRQELVAASILLRNRDGQAASGRQLVQQLGLGTAAAEALAKQLPRPDLMNETFVFDGSEFERQLVYRAVELDNGAILMANSSTFSEVFDQETLGSASDEHPLYKFSTEGRVVDERLRKTK